MKKIIFTALALFITVLTFGQNTWKAHIIDSETKEPLSSATAFLKGTNIGVKADNDGLLTLSSIPDGIQTIYIKLVGYEEKIITLKFPVAQTEIPTISLKATADELETITISSTRSSRSIQDIPTRVEFIAGEELEEKANMKPGDIRMMLSESTGIQTQQTSATSANAAIRIQGLDGRYTQILKDGFPLYAGAASGLGLLQIPPLDLKQVELIKGSASTLYGGGAIAGLVNLISKTPNQERELNFHFDGTDALGLSLNGFYSKRNEKLGTTLFAAYQNNAAYDPAKIDLSAIPKSERFTFNPKLFVYPNAKTTLILGVNTTFENRIGGDMHYIKGNADAIHTYFEQNKTQRISTQFSLDHDLGKCGHFTVKNSLGYFNRVLNTPGYEFNGIQYSTFTEANYANHGEEMEWVGGLNLWTDRFKERGVSSSMLRNYNQNTFGAFLQNTWKANPWLHIETGLRVDHVSDYGFAFLPRISTLFKINPKLTSRLGGGLGYKAPTIFTEDSERIQYKNVLPIDENTNQLEKSYGANWDINYRTALFNQTVSFTINHLFFFTHLKNPLQLLPVNDGNYRFVNVKGNIESKGTETNVKLGYKDFKLFLGYTYTDAHQHQNGIKMENTLTAKHRVNAVLMYELEDEWKIGLEAYSFSKQLLSDGSMGKSYVTTGFMAEKIWGRFSIYINFENFLDVRQTNFDSIYTGTLSSPQFRDIYAPLDGFIMNGGIKFKL
ncbi:TonB-dependent receptor [Pedobacter boryungensis]|uniref:TonB-dependent receptor n=1 Tax=Pedobacter boryungensis TaxID=869962 RepID=A0ABX2DFR5_9SPHI|nr:TonB-dependent receptor [Pedobacter boryungensis]NQX32136.1 TonB-dependent receptor [Pedobacter boryungensis]